MTHPRASRGNPETKALHAIWQRLSSFDHTTRERMLRMLAEWSQEEHKADQHRKGETPP